MSGLTNLRLQAHRLGNSRFAKNVATVATGIAAAQVITLAFTPFLTRLYGPEAFGVLAAFTAILNIITPLSSLGFANAIVMPATEEGAKAVARLSLVCAALVASLALPSVWLFLPQLASWTGLEAKPSFLYLIPVSLLLGALLSVANQMAVREGLFKAKAASYVVNNFLMNIGKLAVGLHAPSGLALIVIAIMGKALNYFLLLARVPRTGAFQVRHWFGIAGILEAASEQRDFALYRMPQSIINALAFGLPVLLITGLFGSAAAGQYSLTVLVLGAPVMLLGQSVTEVFFPKVTHSIREDPSVAASLLRRATFVVALLAIVPFGVIAIFGDVIFPNVFGSDWEKAGLYSQWIAIWMASVLITRPAVSAIPALRLQRALLIYEILTTAVRVGALFLFSKLGNDLTAVGAFAVVNVAGYLLLLCIVLARAAEVSKDKIHV